MLTRLIAIPILSFCTAAASLLAQTPPYAMLQSANLTGSGNSITATQVPVVTPSGTVYVNFSLSFTADATGNLTVATNSFSIGLAPAVISSSFKPGTYVTGSNTLGGTGMIAVSGPSVVAGGATIWTLNAAPGANACTYPGNATWYVGPAAGSPYATRIQAAGLTSSAFSYGLTGSQLCNGGSGSPPWASNTLIGLSQVGNSITISTFTNGKDFALPQDQIVYTLKQQ